MPAPLPARQVAPEVVEAYLKARSQLDRLSAESIGKALQIFREITVRSPDFALGLAGHAACLFSLGWWGHAPAGEVYPSAKQFALQALALDDSLSLAHVVLAWMDLLLDWDLESAAREVRRAIELSPSDTDAHLLHSTLLCLVGRSSEAAAEVQRSLTLNPAALHPNQYAAWMYLHLGHYARAEEQARRTVALFPDSLQSLVFCAWRGESPCLCFGSA